MKFTHLTLLFLILFSPWSYAEDNVLDTQDKLAVEKIVKNLVNKLFLLETTQYESKKLQKELLIIMPDKIASESEYEPITKNKYINFSKRLAIIRKNRDSTSIRDNISPICSYIEDDSIDCDLTERIQYIEKSDIIPQKSHEFEAGTQYKFNLKMNESGEWYINKMKTWNAIPAPKMSTLEIEKKYRQEKLKNKKSRLNGRYIKGVGEIPLPTRIGDMPPSKLLRQKKTDIELAEEEAVKEEQERLLQEYQENRRILEQSNAPRILVDMNGNIIHNNTNRASSRSRIKKKLRNRSCHPIYGCGWSWNWNRGKSQIRK